MILNPRTDIFCVSLSENMEGGGKLAVPFLRYRFFYAHTGLFVLCGGEESGVCSAGAYFYS